jgi:predicted GIY-YIG superfamily endonuclease
MRRHAGGKVATALDTRSRYEQLVRVLINTRFGAPCTGTTTDMQRRVIEHSQGGRRGSKYTFDLQVR